MAELTEREYNLLLQSMTANASAMASINTGLTRLHLELVEKYLTRRESRDQYDDMRKELLRLSAETRTNLEQRIKILQWTIVIQSATVLAVLGYILRLKGV